MMAYPSLKPMSQKEMAAEQQGWQAEADVRTLVEAAKICTDADRHKRAKAKATAMRQELENIKVYEK